MKRTELKRRTPLRASTKLRSGRLNQNPTTGNREWRKVRAWVIDRAKGRCEVRADGCTGHADHVHHVVLRAQGGADTPDNLLASCWRCHSFVHANPALSRERGWLRSPYGGSVGGSDG